MTTPSPTPEQSSGIHSLAALINRVSPTGNLIVIIIAIAVGLISGFGAVALHGIIEGTHTILSLVSSYATIVDDGHVNHTGLGGVSGYIPSQLMVVLMPTFGSLVAGTLVWVFARHDHSHGTAAVMEAVALHGGRLSVRPFLIKVAAAGLLIGAGGSAGPEDPSVQIGAAVGSSVGQRLRLSIARVNTLVTAGVASAIAAAFNAPLAGVFFALEIVAGDFSTTLFAPVVLAAVIASIVGRAMLGAQPAFEVPSYELLHPLIEMPLYVLLGLITAFVGSGFIRTFFLSEAFFDKLRLPAPLRAMLGGLLVGIIALWVPDVLGTGYETAEHVLNHASLAWQTIALLLAAKLLATVITLGAVRVGGSFAPSMVMGAFVGWIFGWVINLIMPSMTAPPAAYALVGMGAMLAAVVRAPITAVLLLFEITNDYYIILAIMASVVSSYTLSHHLHPESIYTERLARKGIQLRFGRDVNILELVTVGEAMTKNFTTVPAYMPLSELVMVFSRTQHHGMPVVTAHGELFGIVTLTDLQQATDRNMPSNTPVSAIATRKLITVTPEQSLNTALNQFALADVGRLPVVDTNNRQQLLGVVRRSDIIKAYRRGALNRVELETRRQQMSLGCQSGAQVIEVNVMPNSPIDGIMIRDMQLPERTIITSILRNGVAIIPKGDTVLQGGDHLTVLAKPEHAEQVQEHLTLGNGAQETTPRYYDLVLSLGANAIGKAVASLRLPPDVLIVRLRRGGNIQAVHGDTVLQENDELTILATTEDLQAVLLCLQKTD